MSDTSLLADVQRIIKRGEKGTFDLSNPVDVKELAIYAAFSALKTKLTQKYGNVSDIIQGAEIAKQNLDDLLHRKNPIPTETEISQAKDAVVAAQNKIDNLSQDVASELSVSSSELEQKTDEALLQQYAAIKPGSPGIYTSVPADLSEFIKRTQGTNPYSRQRECDIRFVKNLALVSEAHSADIELLKTFKNSLVDKIVSYVPFVEKVIEPTPLDPPE